MITICGLCSKNIRYPRVFVEANLHFILIDDFAFLATKLLKLNVKHLTLTAPYNVSKLVLKLLNFESCFPS